MQNKQTSCVCLCFISYAHGFYECSSVKSLPYYSHARTQSEHWTQALVWWWGCFEVKRLKIMLYLFLRDWFWKILIFFCEETDMIFFLCNYHTVIITIFSVSSSGWGRSRECPEAPDPRCQWTSISCTTPGLRCASCAHGRQLSDPSASGSAGILHAPDAAETESHHTSTETPGFGPSGNPSRERVQVCLSHIRIMFPVWYNDIYFT